MPRWPGFSPGVGDTLMTGTMGDRPEVGWAARPGQLYTIMVLEKASAARAWRTVRRSGGASVRPLAGHQRAR